MNIQRGRDHGLPAYNAVREALGRIPADTFEDINADPAVIERLAAAYGSVDDIDLWVGGLAEAPVGAGQLGPLFGQIVADQFRRLRDGDRYWYERTLSPDDRRDVEGRRLSDVIRLNTTIGAELPDNVFVVGAATP